MLPDRARELLTAYVDGELTPPQRRRVRRLVREAAEARELLGRLEEDASRLRGVEPPPLNHDLTAPVLDAIRERHLRPGRRRPPRPVPATFPARAVAAAAASVLLLVGMTTF